jgi:hypothetical protein
MRKHTFLIVDTETTMDDLVADFGAVIIDRLGNVLTSCAVLVRGIFDKPRKHTLFWNDKQKALWAKANLTARYDNYHAMLQDGRRRMATVKAINVWLEKAQVTYNPILTAYNLAFDLGKCGNTGIDLSGFDRHFCLMKAAQNQWAHNRKYLDYVLANHAFNKPRQSRTMTYQTGAEIMSAFVQGHPVIAEPHTGFEDALYFEAPILTALLKKRSAKWLLSNPKGTTWRDVQVKDHFQAKRGRP